MLFVLLSLLTPYAFAEVLPIDPNASASLTLVYTQGEQAFSGLTVNAYRIADVNEDGTYDLTAPFNALPVSIYNITTKAEWDSVSSTLSAYITAEDLEPTYTVVTDDTGSASFETVKTGMYLTLSQRVEKDDTIYTFENVISLVPYPEDDTSLNYSPVYHPKCSSLTPTDEPVEYKVTKQWKDKGFSDHRPDSIEIEIIRDNEKYNTVTLTAENNWSYHWTANDNKAVWQVIETDTNKNYTVTCESFKNTFVITNTYVGEHKDPPVTGDISVTWPYTIAMCVSGTLLIILCIATRKKEGKG